MKTFWRKQEYEVMESNMFVCSSLKAQILGSEDLYERVATEGKKK